MPLKARKTVLCLTVILISAIGAFAQNGKTSTIHFRFDDATLQSEFSNNSIALKQLDSVLANLSENAKVEVEIDGWASPEGVYAHNLDLAKRRALSAQNYLLNHYSFLKDHISITSAKEDWDGLAASVAADQNISKELRNKVVCIITLTGQVDARKKMIQELPQYMYFKRMHYPALRRAEVRVFITEEAPVTLPEITPEPADTTTTQTQPVVIPEPADTTAIISPVTDTDDSELNIILGQSNRDMPNEWLNSRKQETVEEPERHTTFAIKTNLIKPALNLGAEFAIGDDWSAGASWHYAWLKMPSRNLFWQTYGGEMYGRYWFGAAHENARLTGHHVGIYGQAYTYDFELGGNGVMADRFNFGGGIEYGYALPLTKNLAFDFSLGLGYFTGEMKNYTPMDGHYVWQSTVINRWFGPTRAEASLVWIIDHKRNGGKR